MPDVFDLLSEPPVPFVGKPGGGGVFVRVVSQEEWETWQKSIPQEGTPEDEKSVGLVYGGLVKIAACDAGGGLLFKDKPVEEIVRTLNRKVLKALFEQARTLNLITSEIIDAEKKDSADQQDPPKDSGSSSAASTA